MKLTDLRVVESRDWDDYPRNYRSATLDELIRVLIEEGGEVVTYCKQHRLLVRWETASNCAAGAFRNDCEFGEYVLFPIPEEEK